MLSLLNKDIFVCPKCKNNLACDCGYKVEIKNNIIQLTDLPNMNINENEDDKYIGYEHIGTYYSGYDGTAVIKDYNKKVAKVIKEEVKAGLLLDLGCGDGLFAIPILMEGVEVIAGDISNNMMMILYDKVKKLKLDSSLLTLVRMNAYDMPIKDNAVDAIIANSMLHLNSNPEKIIKEIYWVLKPKGKFIYFDDRPGKDNINEEKFDNRDYNDRLEFHYRYFKYLKALNIEPKRYSWRFNRDEICDKLFTYSYEKKLDIPPKVEKATFYEGFYKRMKGKGFSDQAGVTDEVHKMIFNKVDKEMIEKYGKDYKDAVLTYYTNEEFIKVFTK